MLAFFPHSLSDKVAMESYDCLTTKKETTAIQLLYLQFVIHSDKDQWSRWPEGLQCIGFSQMTNTEKEMTTTSPSSCGFHIASL